MYVQYVSTEAVHSDGDALWGVSHATEAAEVIMLPLQAAFEVYSSDAAAVGRCCGPELTRQLDRPLQLTLGSQPAATRLQKQTDCLSFKSPWIYGCGCSCFHFTPLEWT